MGTSTVQSNKKVVQTRIDNKPPVEAEIDNELVVEIEDIMMAVAQECYPQRPKEVAMAMQRISISLQEHTGVMIPNEHLDELRRWARDSIDKYHRQLSETIEIMYT